MSAALQAKDGHPFIAALAASDHAGLVETLAANVVLHAAATGTPFEGRKSVGDVYASVIDAFEELEIVDQFSSGDTQAFFWRGRLEGRSVEGADRLRLDSAGKVREITVVGRPLSGLATFLTGIGPRFARRRRGRLVGGALRLSARPLPPMLARLDWVTRWLARPTDARGRG
jgi:hypothetical protein